MKHPFSRIILLALTAVMLLCLPVSANSLFPEPQVSRSSGTYGDNLTWSLTDDGLLTLSGTGPMADLPYEERWTTLAKKDVVHIQISSGITHIGNGVFSGFSSLKSVSMANTVTSIGDYAFDFCEALESVSLSDNIVTVGSYVFRRCSGLKSIILPDGITEIGEQTFHNCSELESVTLPDNLATIGKYAFYQCRNLKTLILPDALETIGEYAFSDCSALEHIEIPNSTTAIGVAAFAHCTALEDVSLPCGPLQIGNSAFTQCTNLKNVRFSISAQSDDSITTTIGSTVFSGCRSLQSVNLPYGITEIGERTFGDCFSLQSVVLPDSLKNLSTGLFENCTSLERIVIPKGIETVPSYAFRRCTSLSQVTIPDTVTRINNQAFEDCTSLHSLLLPGSVTYLDHAIFNGCTALETVTVYHDSVSPWKTFHAGAPEDVVYRCHEGSSMHAFAIEHNLNYELLTDWDTVFSDISSDDAAYSAICHMADRGIFVGTSDDTFSPEMPLTRAMFVTLLGRMAGIDANAYTEQIFDDIPVDAWYAPYAAWAADEGIVIGIGDHHFGGDMLIDIQQAVTMLARYSGFPWDIVNSGQSAYDFPDSTEEMTYWSDSGIFWAVSIGLYEGKNGLLDLYTPLTRADTALLFSRFCQLILGA